jgi:hypothetical protein
VSSLDEQIRAKVAAMRHNAQKRGIDADEERDPRLAQLAADTEDLATALLAVLDEHEEGDSHLCPSEIVGYSVQHWHDENDPCPTQRAIAEKLGIEAAP